MPPNDRYDQVSFKASHNTYDHDPDLPKLLATETLWSDDHPYLGGCRGLEFDVIAQAGNTGYCVKHAGDYQGEGECLQFSKVLKDLKAWSDLNAGHDVMHISIDIKSGAGTPGEFAEGFDAYIRLNFDAARIYPPGEFLGTEATLVKAAAARPGWPTLAELRGRFVFCLSGADEYKSGYTDSSLKDRLCFADRNLTDGYSKEKSANRLFVNVLMSLMGTMPYQFYEERKTPGVMTRAYSKYVGAFPWVRSISNKRLWTRCLDKGFNILATDRISDTDWASVGDGPFVKRAGLP